jgi:hypothetical protein
MDAELIRDGGKLLEAFLVHVPSSFAAERSGESLKGKRGFPIGRPARPGGASPRRE